MIFKSELKESIFIEMNNDDKISLINAYIKYYNEFEIGKLLNLIHRDIKFENLSDNKITPSANGIDQFKELANRSKNLFSIRAPSV